MRGVIAATKCGADTHIPGAAKLHETCREKYSAQLAEAESWIARCTAEIAFLTEVPPVNLFAPARDTQQLPTLREGKHDAK